MRNLIRAMLALTITIAGIDAGLAAELTVKKPNTTAVAHISAEGKIVDSRGRPQAHVRVVLRVMSNHLWNGPGTIDVADVLAETRSDDVGRFAFENAPLAASMSRIVDMLDRGDRGAEVVAVADGFGLGWTPLHAFSTNDLTVVLPPAAALEGTIEDDEAHAVPGAIIEIVAISRPDARENGYMEESDPDYLALNFSALRLRAVGDAKGHFRIAGLPGGRRLHASVAHPDYPHKFFAVDLDAHASPQPADRDRDGAADQVDLYVNPVKLVVARGPRLVIKVADESGKPLGGGCVQLSRSGAWTSRVPLDGVVRAAVAISDEKIAGLQDGEYRITYLPPDGVAVPSVNRGVRLTDADIATPREIELRLPATRIIEGRVVAKGTDVGIPGLTVAWAAAAHGVFNNSKSITDRDGGFRVPAFLGKGRLSVQGDAPGYFVVDSRTVWGTDLEKYARPVDLPGSGAIEPVRLEIARGLVLKGRLLDPRQSPVSAAVVRATSTGRLGMRQQAITDSEGRFVLSGMNPRAGCRVSATGDALLAWHSVADADDQPLDGSRTVEFDLRFEAAVTLTGRVLCDGKALAGVRMALLRGEPVKEGTRMYRLADVVTDADGRYRLSGLKPGDSYHIEVKPSFPAVDPNWQHQSPWMPTLADGASGEVALPDMNLRRMTQTLAGMVVDPDGKPVAGAEVSAGLVDSYGSLFRTSFGPLPWTETGRTGRFYLSVLPDMPLEITAYMKPREGDTEVRFPARVKAKLNQQDIRIVLDPSLVEEEE